ncbi:hypothetical protein GHT06_022624 [Daphnia sinensis]|uniref:PPPDE domain-containing protein n=1 Tax=Daphnia sinensis TaxID=1820382 RepID=A0AAD5KIM0_9CRUS|nr:hypothetical protein GHT06_022624 [Daphnia sinensis]
MSIGITGGDFRRILYFVPRADEPDTSGYWIPDGELSERLSSFIDPEEKIENAALYSHPLVSMQLTNGLLFHAFIVIETLNWWWSIEKNTEYIMIQRSSDIESVRDMCKRKKRTTGPTIFTGIRMNKTTRGGNITIKEFIDYMWRKDVLNNDYHFVSANCQQFAALLFDRIESPQNHLVYFDKAADQPPSTEHSCYMTAEQVLTEVQRLCVPETLKNLELYELEKYCVPWFVKNPLFCYGFGFVILVYSIVVKWVQNSFYILIFFLCSFVFLSFYNKKMLPAVPFIFVAILYFYYVGINTVNIIYLSILFLISFLYTYLNLKKMAIPLPCW